MVKGSVKLTSELVHGFTKSLLAHKFDSPKPTPWFHLEMWDYCCLDDPYVAIAAPRGHAKSTAISLCYVLASLMFRASRYIWILSDTETQAIQFLQDIKTELLENEELRSFFGVRKLLKDNEKDIICSMGPDNWKFRISAKSSNGSVRGGKWNNLRPDLIVGDDLENDEIVMNLDRREKFRNWFFSAVIPALSDSGKIRLVGTILHEDSFLNRLMPPTTGEGSEFTVREPLKISSTDPEAVWKSVLYRAHPSIDDFSQILWPDKFTEKRLRQIRSSYLKQGFPEGYSQELLNDPVDQSHAYFRKEDLLPMDEEDKKLRKVYYAGCDFAVTVNQRADWSVIVIGGIDDVGQLHIVDVRRGKWDSKQIIDEIFSVQKRYEIDVFVGEKGTISNSILPFLHDEMLRKDRPIVNMELVPRNTDKRQMARSIQGRIRAGGVKFDKQASWYQTFEEEMVRFDRGVNDDQVDAVANLGLFLNKMLQAPTAEEILMQEYEEDKALDDVFNFRSQNSYTGY